MRSMVRATEMRRMPAASEPKRRTAAPPLASCPKHAQRWELAQLALASDAPDRAHRVSESAPPATPPPSAHCDARTARTAPQRSPESGVTTTFPQLRLQNHPPSRATPDVPTSTAPDLFSLRLCLARKPLHPTSSALTNSN